VQLELAVERATEATVDKDRLLEVMQGDKTALSRAIAQNKELKNQLAELQNSFVKMVCTTLYTHCSSVTFLFLFSMCAVVLHAGLIFLCALVLFYFVFNDFFAHADFFIDCYCLISINSASSLDVKMFIL